MLARGLCLAALTFAFLLPTLAVGQTVVCTLETVEPEGVIRQDTRSGFIFLDDPFVARCPDGEELRARSGRVELATWNIYLLGDVFFQDTAQTLTAREATYDPNASRLWARGNVVYVDRNQGSTLRGPELEYLRATENRPIAEMTATGRPTLVMPPSDAAEPDEPLELTANRVEMIGEDQLSAFGNVVITRADLRATSEEARYNSTTEALALRSSAAIRSGEFELLGDTIDARLAEGALEFLQSRSGAILQGEELRVTGDDLLLEFRDELLQRVIARIVEDSGHRAVATSTSFQLEADSLDAFFVDQRLDEVHAIGDAYGQSIDTVAVAGGGPEGNAAGALAGRPELPDPSADILARDWIRGDTIIGYFVAVPPASESDEPVLEADAADPPGLAEVAAGPRGPEAIAGGPADSALEAGAVAIESEEGRESVELERLVAIGGAQSLYRMNDPGSPGVRNVNFLVGRRIELEVADGELQVARVEGLQYGIYLDALEQAEPVGAGLEEAGDEPLPDPAAPAPGGA